MSAFDMAMGPGTVVGVSYQTVPLDPGFHGEADGKVDHRLGDFDFRECRAGLDQLP